MKTRLTRRSFLKQTPCLAAALGLSRPWLIGAAPPGSTVANTKLNLGVIGVAGRGGANLNEVAHENIAALCDVDARQLASAAQRFPQAATFRDFRRLLDRKDLDGVVISTPDHTHAVAAAAALSGGRHVYCEKPLTRTVSEARVVTDLARQHRRITQIGTQIHAGSNYRRVVELVQRNAVGTIREVHVWSSSSYGGMDLPRASSPVPEHLDYDLWLGPVMERPYSPEYLPGKWRHWWAFGGGALADFGCHFMDLPYWALGLSHPTRVEPVAGPPVHPESTPPWLIVKYQYPARGSQPPVVLTWYHGGRKPSVLEPGLAAQWNSGVLFVGDKGQVLSDYSRHVLLPQEAFADFAPPDPFIEDSIGHHREWTQACKGEGRTTCSFDYSGPLTEAALLGNVAYRAGSALDWDWARLKANNSSPSDAFIQHQYRSGWSLPG